LIVQGNKLVEGKYNYSLWELRVFIEMVQSIGRHDKEFKPIRIYITDLIKQYGSKSNDDYRRVSLAAVRLMRKSVKIDYITEQGEERVHHSPLVISVDTPKKLNDGFEKYIELQFPERIRPLLLDLKKNYLLYDKKNILNLKSKFSVRIYQILKSHERETKEVVVVGYQVSQLRAILLVDDDGNPTKQYKQYGQFEEKVILKAQKELEEKTDIVFRFDKIKKGRSIHTINFYVRKNRKNQTSVALPETTETIETPVALPETTETKYENKDLQKLVKIGVTASVARKLVETHDSNLISYTIKKAHQEDEKRKLTNFAGFVVKSLKNGDYKKELVNQEKREKKNRAKAKDKAVKEKNHKQIEQLHFKFEEELREIAFSMFQELTPKDQELIFNQVRENYVLVGPKTSDAKIIERHRFSLEMEVISYMSEKKKLTAEENDFYKWMESKYNTKVIKNGDLFEIVN